MLFSRWLNLLLAQINSLNKMVLITIYVIKSALSSRFCTTTSSVILTLVMLELRMFQNRAVVPQSDSNWKNMVQIISSSSLGLLSCIFFCFHFCSLSLSDFSGVLAEDFLCFPQLDEAQHLPQRLECDAASDQQVRRPSLFFSLSHFFHPLSSSIPSFSHLALANGMQCILNLHGPLGIGIIALNRVVLLPDEEVAFFFSARACTSLILVQK